VTNPNYTGGAFGCSPTACRFQPGNSLTYHIVADKFTSDEREAIEDAAAAWRAGANQINRGADWELDRGSDWAIGTLSISDNDTGISAEDDTWFLNQGVPSSNMAATFAVFGSWPNCGFTGVDILFRESVSWTTKLPAAADSGDMSLGQVAIHEFGHMIGFDESDVALATMNSEYPAGGDISASYRISERDYDGLRDNYGDSSTGKNLMLSKFLYLGGGEAEEGWDGSDVYASPGDTLSGSADPEDINVILTGTTGTLSNVSIRWYFRPLNTACGGPGSITVGTSSGWSVGVNNPFTVNLSSWVVPANLSPGDYKICAKVDPDDDFTEASEIDNSIATQKNYTIY
jgi:hypothetical protein